MRNFWLLFVVSLATPLLSEAKSENKKNVKIAVTTYFKGLNKPWGMAFLPNGDLLVTEKPGHLRLIKKGGRKATLIKGLPAIHYAGQGGLLDVTVDTLFAKNKLIYLSFSEMGKNGLSGTAVFRAKLAQKKLQNGKVIWRQQPKIASSLHFGSRIAVTKKRELFITMGDRYIEKDGAQLLNNHFGKVVRIMSDGTIPKDNPFFQRKGALKDIWSYGHRNVQGAAIHPATLQLWTHEHGAKGGDEINIDRAGKNYGWPVITHGVDYSGEKIGIGTHKKGMEQPLHFWTPSIAPCGMLFYTGKMFPEWNGNLFIGSLKFRYLDRIVLKGNQVTREEKLLTSLGDRVRDVAQGPHGAIFVAFDKINSDIVKISRE